MKCHWIEPPHAAERFTRVISIGSHQYSGTVLLHSKGPAKALLVRKFHPTNKSRKTCLSSMSWLQVIDSGGLDSVGPRLS